MKVRRPKVDRRMRAEGRRPKPELGDLRSGSQWEGLPQSGAEDATGEEIGPLFAPCALPGGYVRLLASPLGFRGSAFSRPSTFGLRTLVFANWLLATHSLFAAATNPPAADEIPALRPPHAEIPATFWEQHSLAVIVVGVLVLVGGAAAAWFLTRPKPAVVIPPEILARKALELLRQQPEDGLLLSRVSQVLHQYVTAAFNLPPEELTTAEFCREIAGHAQIGPELAAAVSDFLRQCDRQKFSPPPAARSARRSRARNQFD